MNAVAEVKRGTKLRTEKVFPGTNIEMYNVWAGAQWLGHIEKGETFGWVCAGDPLKIAYMSKGAASQAILRELVKEGAIVLV